MNSKLVIAALMVLSTVANAQGKGRVESRETEKKAAAAAKTLGKSQAGGDLNARLVDSVKQVREAQLAEVTAGKRKAEEVINVRTDINLVQAAKDVLNSMSSKDAALKKTLINEIDYVSSLTLDVEAMASFAKIVDLASRKPVTAENEVYKQMIRDLGKNLTEVQKEIADGKLAGTTDILSESIKRTLGESKKKDVENCI
jgi:hypothetical protein